MSQTFYGTDYSWLALDGRDAVGWLSLNMCGPVPERLCEDPDGMLEHEARLGVWVRSTGRAFRFGAGDSMWRDAAAVGVFPFDFDDKAQEYRLVVTPGRPVTGADVPSDLRELLVVKLVTADFSQGFVTPEHVDGALSL
jgi:hypothetical protein